jgi:peptide/nickel transport system ATP-binding protein
MTYPLLNIEDLSVSFNTNEGLIGAIENITLKVNRNEILAIVGESGSGKSVTSLSILRLLQSPPAIYRSGHTWFSVDGQQRLDLLHSDEGMLRSIRGRDIAMIFQEPMTSLNPVLKCIDQVQEAILAHKNISKRKARAQAIKLFETVGLPSPSVIGDRYPHQLSGGQKQRVMIAMAMSCSPSLLICDEPTTALDVTVQKTVLETIKSLQVETGMGVIFITHDLGVVADIADRIAVMYKGKIVELNTSREIFNTPQHPYTKALIACRPSNHAKGEPLPVVTDFLRPDENKMGDDPLHSKLPHPIVSNNDELPPASKDQNTILSVHELSVHFTYRNESGKKEILKAVDQVSFDMSQGETLGLAGESGSGKTTLGRAILQLIPFNSGKVLFKGEDISELTDTRMRSLRRQMQIIFQDPYSSLNPRISIGQAIAETMQVHTNQDAATIREKTIHLLEKVGLYADHYKRYPHEFSGGQRQRIVISRALALEPSFIVCDESVSALDVSVQAQVLNLLNDLKKEFGFSALFISHDLAVLKYISDRMMIMQRGRILEIGESEKVYGNPSHPYTRELLEAIPGFDRR